MAAGLSVGLNILALMARHAWITEASTPAAKAEYEKSDFLEYENAAGEVADFHTLRNTFIAIVVKSGVDPKTAKELARHSTITLTMDRYSHIGQLDMHSAVERLSDRPEIERETALAKEPIISRSTVRLSLLVLPLVRLLRFHAIP